MDRLIGWIRRFIRELRRRRVIRVAVVYAGTAFVILQLGEILVEPFGLPGWTLRMVTFLLILGFPLAVGLAWVYNVTEEGVVKVGTKEKTAPPLGPGGKPFTSNPVIVGLLVLTGGLLLYSHFITSSERVRNAGGAVLPQDMTLERSIAVLPFKALGEEQPGPFTEGIHDDLLTRLSNISDLEVISRTSVQQYRGTDKTTAEIAKELGVKWVLEGGVQEMGDRIQVNAQLINPRTDTHAWTGRYQRDKTTEELFAIQGEITREIARSLKAQLTEEEKKRVVRRPTENLSAYRLYLQGRTHLDRRSETGMRRAIQLFQRAIEQDSSYALAWAGLADARTLLMFYGHASSEQLYPQALAAARTAVSLEPDLAEAQAALAHLRRHRGEMPAALRAFEKSVELKPSYAVAHQELAELYGALGQPQRALSHARKAVNLSSRSPANRSVLAWTYWWIEGPGDKALKHVRKAVDLEPGYALGHAGKGLMLSSAGQQKEAITALREGLDLTQEGSLPWSLCTGGLGVAHARLGDEDRAHEQLARLRQKGDAPLKEAMIFAALDEPPKVFEALREMEWTGVNIRHLRFMQVFDPLREDPRYDKLLREINVQWGLNPDGSLPEGIEASDEIISSTEPVGR